ncbi:hypothetical protein MTO96_013207 [Rhipicephalus appendiculatus]
MGASQETRRPQRAASFITRRAAPASGKYITFAALALIRAARYNVAEGEEAVKRAPLAERGKLPALLNSLSGLPLRGDASALSAA